MPILGELLLSATSSALLFLILVHVGKSNQREGLSLGVAAWLLCFVVVPVTYYWLGVEVAAISFMVLIMIDFIFVGPRLSKGRE